MPFGFLLLLLFPEGGNKDEFIWPFGIEGKLNLLYFNKLFKKYSNVFEFFLGRNSKR
jgi:hypothetical protein